MYSTISLSVKKESLTGISIGCEWLWYISNGVGKASWVIAKLSNDDEGRYIVVGKWLHMSSVEWIVV